MQIKNRLKQKGSTTIARKKNVQNQSLAKMPGGKLFHHLLTSKKKKCYFPLIRGAQDIRNQKTVLVFMSAISTEILCTDSLICSSYGGSLENLLSSECHWYAAIGLQALKYLTCSHRPTRSSYRSNLERPGI